MLVVLRLPEVVEAILLVYLALDLLQAIHVVIISKGALGPPRQL